MAITHHEKLTAYSNDPNKPVSKDAWVAAHDMDPIVNADISTSAAIVESKLSLNYPTHIAVHTHTNTAQQGIIDHVSLTNIGTNTHAAIDTHIANTSNPHSVTKTQVGLGSVPNTDCTNASNIASGTLSGTLLPAMDTATKGGVPATGTPSGKFLKDDGTWATVTSGLSGTAIVDNIVTVASTTGSMKDSGWSRDIDTGLTANSDLRIPSQKAVKTYVDGAVSAVPQISIKSYQAIGDGKQYADGNMAAGSAILTSATGAFVVGDVGKAIVVNQAPVYVKSDPGTYLTLSSMKVKWTAMPANTISYVYDDLGAGYITGDFTILFDYSDIYVSGGGTSAENLSFVSDTPNALPAATNNSIGMQINVASGSQTFYAVENYGGVQYTSAGLAITTNTHYWVKITRVGTAFTVYIYSDAGRTALVGSQTLTLHAAITYQYYYPVTSLNAGLVSTATGYIQNWNLGNAVLPLVTTIASYQSATQVTLSAAATIPVINAPFAWGTDNTTYIQNAINAGRTLGTANIVVPFGRYLCTGNLTLYSNITLKGASTGPFYNQQMRIGSDPASNSIPQIWITNTSNAFIQGYIKTTGSMTSGSNIVTAIPDTSMLFVGEIMSAWYGSGSVPYPQAGAPTTYGEVVTSIDSGTQIHMIQNANYTGSVNILFGMNSVGIEDLLFYYPAQNLQSDIGVPATYPATIKLINQNGCKIRRCSFVNSYRAIDIGTGPAGDYDGYGSYNTLGWLQDLHIGGLMSGVEIDHTFDVIEASNILVHPLYDLMGPDQPNTVGFPTHLDEWVFNNQNQGFTFKRVDAFMATNIFMLWKYAAFAFTDSPDTWLDYRTSYGDMVNVHLDGMIYGILPTSTRSTVGWAINNLSVSGAGQFGNYSGTAAIKCQPGGSDSIVIKVTAGRAWGTFSDTDIFEKNGVANAKLDIQNVLGYNPKGAIGPPAIPTSGVALTNPYAYPVRVFIAGGTVTAISIGANATGLTSGTFELGANESIKLTYSVAPTWTWFGM